MPLGNGDLAANVWVEPDGVLYFYISKSDAWDENGRLIKLGRLRVELEPNPLQEAGAAFSQELRAEEGLVEIRLGAQGEETTLRLWADAEQPVLHVQGQSKRARKLRVALELWRTERRPIPRSDRLSVYGVMENPEGIFEDPDAVLTPRADRAEIRWLHRNRRSIYSMTMEGQGLGELLHEFPDPLLHLTSGATVLGEGLEQETSSTLVSTEPLEDFHVRVIPLVARTESVEEWEGMLNERVEALRNRNVAEAWNSHKAWWRDFWSRSYIRLDEAASDQDAESGEPVARLLNRGYALQRFIHAAAGRGEYPIKFNGSLFTVDGQGRWGPDHRAWGGCYWWQNTRLPYWSMLRAGDYDLMRPLWDLFLDTLPMQEARSRVYFGHGGAHYPETMYFWGTYNLDNYGWNRPEDFEVERTLINSIQWYWLAGIEFGVMLLDRYEAQPDEALARDYILPIVDSVLEFYALHYPKDEAGKLRIWPANSLETYRFEGCLNPTPDVAGLHRLAGGMLELLPEDLVTDRQREDWTALREALPDVPLMEKAGRRVIAPAEAFNPERGNFENPELYPVWPFRLYGLGKPDLEIARATYALRDETRTGGWFQDGIQAACLGLTEEAARIVLENFRVNDPESRFPAFWQANYDWVPDQDHGSVSMLTLQNMLLQCEGRRILLFPTWPADWDLRLRLHATEDTVVEAELAGGELRMLDVQPASRREDVEIWLHGKREKVPASVK